MSRINPEDNLTPAELENLNLLEAIAQDGLDAYVDVADALAEIRDRHLYRDSHPSFEAYVSERWRVDITSGAERQPSAAVRNKPCEALAKACEETLSALDGDDRLAVEIRLAVRKPGVPGALADALSLDPQEIATTRDDDLLPTLRWLLTKASGTLGEVAHQLERHAADIDDGAREQLRDDIYVLDDELATVKALLLDLVDWDSELERLLQGELPPFDTDRDPEDDD